MTISRPCSPNKLEHDASGPSSAMAGDQAAGGQNSVAHSAGVRAARVLAPRCRPAAYAGLLAPSPPPEMGPRGRSVTVCLTVAPSTAVAPSVSGGCRAKRCMPAESGRLTAAPRQRHKVRATRSPRQDDEGDHGQRRPVHAAASASGVAWVTADCSSMRDLRPGPLGSRRALCLRPPGQADDRIPAFPFPLLSPLGRAVSLQDRAWGSPPAASLGPVPPQGLAAGGSGNRGTIPRVCGSSFSTRLPPTCQPTAGRRRKGGDPDRRYAGPPEPPLRVRKMDQ